MNKLYLNPFIFILKKDQTNYINTPAGYTFFLSDSQLKILLEKKIFLLEDLVSFFSEKEISDLIENQVFINNIVDVNIKESRTKAFFKSINLEKEQMELKDKNILIFGAGAIGTHISWGLVSMGIKNITIVDYDEIELSNLNRQLFYKITDVGKSKIEVLKKNLIEIDEHCNIKIINKKIENKQDIKDIVCGEKYNLIVKGVDNPPIVSEWIFSIAEDEKIGYVSGGTIGINTMYGPSYYPNSNVSYKNIYFDNKIFYNEENTDILYGTGVSSSITTEKVASEILTESIKILLNLENKLKFNGKIIIENILLNNSRRSILKFQKYDVPILLCVFFLTLASIFISNIYFNLLIILLIPFLLVIFYKEDRIYMSKISFISGSIFGLVNVLNNTFSIVYSQRHSISSLIDFGNNLFLMLTTICLNIILMMIITNIYFYIQKTYICKFNLFLSR